MKIFQFTPNIIKSPETAKKSAGPGRTEGGSDFGSVLKKAAAKNESAGPGGAVSLENRRALQVPSAGDLGLAGRLLGLLKSDIQAASPEALNNVHNLEGLIYVYNSK